MTMNTATIKFDAFETLKNDDCQDRIIIAKKSLKDKIVTNLVQPRALVSPKFLKTL